MDDHAVFQVGDPCLEGALMAPGAHGHHDLAAALDGSFHVGGNKVEEGASGTLEAVLIALHAVQQDAGLVNILQGGSGKGHCVIEADFLAGQLHIGRTGLTGSAAAQNRDRHILQIFHVSHKKHSFLMSNIDFRFSKWTH